MDEEQEAEDGGGDQGAQETSEAGQGESSPPNACRRTPSKRL